MMVAIMKCAIMNSAILDSASAMLESDTYVLTPADSLQKHSPSTLNSDSN